MKKNIFAQTFGASHKHLVIPFAEEVDPRSAGIASSAQQYSAQPGGGSPFHADGRSRRHIGPRCHFDRGGGFGGLPDPIAPTSEGNGCLYRSLCTCQNVFAPFLTMPWILVYGPKAEESKGKAFVRVHAHAHAIISQLF
jgi:hypothetical protein